MDIIFKFPLKNSAYSIVSVLCLSVKRLSIPQIKKVIGFPARIEEELFKVLLKKSFKLASNPLIKIKYTKMKESTSAIKIYKVSLSGMITTFFVK